MAATEKQKEALARAREIKKIRGTELGSNLPPPILKPKATNVPSYEEVWLRGLLTAMRGRDVKIAKDVQPCVNVANAVLDAYKEKF